MKQKHDDPRNFKTQAEYIAYKVFYEVSKKAGLKKKSAMRIAKVMALIEKQNSRKAKQSKRE